MKIEEILAKHIDNIIREDISLEAYLDKYPEADQVKSLLKVAVDFRESGQSVPPPTHASINRESFLALVDEAADLPVVAPSEIVESGFIRKISAWLSGNRLRQTAIIATAFLTFSGGVAVAASGVLPTSPLYNVKQLEERTNIALPRSAFSKASLHLDLAGNRLSEIERLLDNKALNLIPGLFVNLNQHLRAASDLESRMNVTHNIATENRINNITGAEDVLLNKYKALNKSKNKKAEPAKPKIEKNNETDNKQPGVGEDKSADIENERPENDNHNQPKAKENKPQSETGEDSLEPLSSSGEANVEADSKTHASEDNQKDANSSDDD